jgi:hypothetical protein
MRAPWCLAVLIVLLIVLTACLCRDPTRLAAKDGLRPGRGNRLWPTAATGYYWNREAWPRRRRRLPAGWGEAAQAAPWRHAAYADPLELSLPLYNFSEYLYDYPPSSRLPYNA